MVFIVEETKRGPLRDPAPKTLLQEDLRRIPNLEDLTNSLFRTEREMTSLWINMIGISGGLHKHSTGRLRKRSIVTIHQGLLVIE